MKSGLLRAAALLVCLRHGSGKIMRNNALMTKMVSDFHKEPEPDEQPRQPQVLGLMQNVLCKNFPSVPCEMIVGDKTLNNLIERSIQQLKYKKLSLEKTTLPPGHQLTMFPMVNSEELSNYLAVRNTGYFEEDKRRKKPHTAVTPKATFWSANDDKSRKSHKAYKSKRTAVFSGRKNIRKFYPHKVKYKDKNTVNTRKDFGDYSEDKLSMSVEEPDMTLTKKHQHFSYRREPENPPVWRIDYTKHGEPSLNHFGFEGDPLKGKMIKLSPNMDESILEHTARKDVMHPDMYIKKNVRNAPMEFNSEGME